MAKRVRELMSTQPIHLESKSTVLDAAEQMRKADVGAVIVENDSRLCGIVTDRDIAVRAVALGKSPDTPVREVMSQGVLYCYVDEDIDDVASNMADIKVRRLPVLDPEKRMVGIVSLGDIAMADGPQSSGVALCGSSEPGGDHSPKSAATAH